MISQSLLILFSRIRKFFFGDFSFGVNALTDSDVVISGVTNANSSILISYNDVNNVILAGNDGKFSYNLDLPLDIGMVIIFNAKLLDDVIYHTKVITIVYSGELVLDNATSVVSFKLEPIINSPIFCPRDNGLNVSVTDSRVNSTDWKL